MTAVEDVDVAAFTVPTEQPAADGTLTWNSTTLRADADRYRVA